MGAPELFKVYACQTNPLESGLIRNLQIWIKTHTLINKCMHYYPHYVHVKRKDSESTKRF